MTTHIQTYTIQIGGRKQTNWSEIGVSNVESALLNDIANGYNKHYGSGVEGLTNFLNSIDSTIQYSILRNQMQSNQPVKHVVIKVTLPQPTDDTVTLEGYPEHLIPLLLAKKDQKIKVTISSAQLEHDSYSAYRFQRVQDEKKKEEDLRKEAIFRLELEQKKLKEEEETLALQRQKEEEEFAERKQQIDEQLTALQPKEAM